MRLLAIDPGPVESALLVYDTDTRLPEWWQMATNEPGDHTSVREWIGHTSADWMVVEMVASYGMPVGREVFETCVWIGRFLERWDHAWTWRRHRPDPAGLVYRHQVKTHLCGNQRAKDANIRQALIDRYGPGKELAIGRKAAPGPLYGLTGDCWSALAVAVTAADTILGSERAA